MKQNELAGILTAIRVNQTPENQTRIDYTLSHKASFTDYRDLVKELAPDELKLKAPKAKAPKAPVNTPAEAPAPAPVETPKAKLPKGTKSAKTPEPTKPAEAPKAKVDKPKVNSVPAPSKMALDHLPTAKFFPADFSTEAGKFKSRPDIKSFAEFKAACEAGIPLFLAAFWTKRHIAEFQYAQNFGVAKPESFPFDLDLLQPVVFCENIERLYAMSVYTEGMSRFEGTSFIAVEDTDDRDNSHFFVRINTGLEFEIFERVAEEAPEKENSAQ